VLTLSDGSSFTIPNLRYRGRANVNDTGIAANDQIESSTNEIKGSVSYVTGTHAFKFGMSNLTGVQTYNSPDSNTPYNYRFLNGVPNQLTLRQNQYFGIKGRVSPEFAAFAQDKWTIDRLTLNLGLRFDHGVSSWDEFHFGPGILVPNRDITFPETDWYRFDDLSPRLAGAYDLFGTGRTALKVNIGKYPQGLLPTDGNPISTRMVNRVTRTWTDADNDLFPDCDLTNPQAQDLRAGGGDFCGVISDLRFGTSIPSTSYDPETLEGWNKRKNNWEFSTSVQHEITTGLGIDVGFFRRWYGNFTVTQNRALTPADFNTYSIPVPLDPRLPNSGQTLGGLRDVVPGKFGLVDNYVTRADNFGSQTEVFNGVDISANARLKGIIFRGGISTGKTTSDVCDIVVAHPEVTVTTSLGTVQSIDMCHLETPFLTQGKLLATYSVPRIGVDVAATLQNLPGPQIAANYIATNAVIQPSLGRPLAGSTPNTTINLVAPGAMYGERLNQLDLRFTRLFRFSGRTVRANFDIYNATNGNTVRAVNSNYAAWLVPTGILDPRLFKISAQVDF
jgi:hypothetical protein